MLYNWFLSHPLNDHTLLLSSIKIVYIQLQHALTTSHHVWHSAKHTLQLHIHTTSHHVWHSAKHTKITFSHTHYQSSRMAFSRAYQNHLLVVNQTFSFLLIEVYCLEDNEGITIDPIFCDGQLLHRILNRPHT